MSKLPRMFSLQKAKMVIVRRNIVLSCMTSSGKITYAERKVCYGFFFLKKAPNISEFFQNPCETEESYRVVNCVWPS